MTREKKRWNALDAFWILLILLSAVGIALRGYSLRSSDTATDETLVMLRVSDLHPLFAACVESGEPLYLPSGEEWGRLVSAERVPTTIRLIKDGKEIVGTYDEADRIDLLLTVRVSGAWQGELFLRNGRDALLVGERRELYGKRIYLAATVASVENRIPKTEKKTYADRNNHKQSRNDIPRGIF